MEGFIMALLAALGVYVLLGLAFGVYFFLAGAKRLDPLVSESKWTVRLLLFPGAVGVWPLLVVKLLSLKSEKA